MAADVCVGSKSEVPPLVWDVRSTSDIVAKVENRSALKISQKLIFGRLCGWVALQCYSVIDFGRNNVVPHVAARKTHQRL